MICDLGNPAGLLQWIMVDIQQEQGQTPITASSICAITQISIGSDEKDHRDHRCQHRRCVPVYFVTVV
ncbi:hypothetical protein WAI453_008813 [Rhynchosporium graminicola]